MTHFQKRRISSLLRWVSFNFPQNYLKTSRPPLFGSFVPIGGNPRFYGRKSAVKSQDLAESSSDSIAVGEISHTARAEAQEALLEYLHSTRSLPFMLAEHMSKNSPLFLEELLGKVETGPADGVNKRSITRFLGYHPINEFEPFFESVGLKPFQFVPILPRNLIYLTDNNLLLENYNVLCNYGIARDKIGHIYMEATEVFGYHCGILKSKLQAFEDMGLHRSFVLKAVASSPSILAGDLQILFIKELEELKALGIEYSWIEGHLLDRHFYSWTPIRDLLCFFRKFGCNKKQLRSLISQHPDLLLEDSGNSTFSLIGFMLKFGSTANEILSMFLQFPHIKVGKFLQNMRQCYVFLIDIMMETEEIGRVVRSHPILVGSCVLKQTSSLLASLNCGKKRICEIIKEDPEVLKMWVLGSRVEPLPDSGESLRSQKQKVQFLLDLGFVENSNEMKKALKLCRGKGGELQERLDCFVKAGLDRKDVLKMIKRAPRVLGQSKDVIEDKINLIINDFGYPISSLVASPACIGFTIQRIKLRFTMYNWLRDQGAAEPNLALTTILSSSEKYFVSQYVNRLPRGPAVWEEFRKQIYPE